MGAGSLVLSLEVRDAIIGCVCVCACRVAID